MGEHYRTDSVAAEYPRDGRALGVRAASAGGELAVLEQAWQEAEEIAAIADSLLVPRAVTERVRRCRNLLVTGGG
jgi:hypothetical protein